MQKTKSLALILGVLAMSFLVGYLVLAWTEPTATPPGVNVPSPLNVSINAQSKEGALVVGANSGVTTGLIVRYGNVGIGITSPGAKLEVAGQVKITGGNPGANKILTSDAAGLASWQTPVSAGGAPVGASYVVMALDGTLTAERRLTAGTGITISDGGANSNVTVGLSYPSKTCGSGYAVQSFNVGSSAAPTCVAVGSGGCSNVFNGIYADSGSIVSASGCSSKFYIKGEDNIKTRTSGNKVYIGNVKVPGISACYTNSASDSSGERNVTVGCSSGYFATGGGCTKTGTNDIMYNRPYGNGWWCYLTPAEGTLTVYVRCCK